MLQDCAPSKSVAVAVQLKIPDKPHSYTTIISHNTLGTTKGPIADEVISSTIHLPQASEALYTYYV